MADDYGNINIRWLITNSILRAETRLADHGTAKAELASLAALIQPWLKKGDKFWEEVEKLEEEAVKIQAGSENGEGIELRVEIEEGEEKVKVYLAQWPRLALPNWQLRYLSLCIEAAKRNRLLDWERTRYR